MQENANNIEEVEDFRERLQRLVRQLEQFESHEDMDGEPMATSYAQALMVLLDFQALEQAPHALGPCRSFGDRQIQRDAPVPEDETSRTHHARA